MSKPSFVYVTYIAAPADKVWRALVDGNLTRDYWFGPNGPLRHTSTWKADAPWESRRTDDSVAIAGTVIESTPPRRLVMTWGRPTDARRSVVTFDIEPQREGTVRLTVVHDELEPDDDMARQVTGGWPKVLASLKTYLETGRSIAGTLW